MARVVVATGFGGPEVLSVVEEAVPQPRHGEVTIRVRAAAVNPIDYKFYSGAMGADPATLPLRVGQELSGVVTAAGPDAVGPDGPVGVGDEVIAYRRDAPGAYATEVTWPAGVVLPKPANLTWDQASGLLLTGATAVHALTAVQVTAGETVLVHGVSGGTGLAIAQLVLLRGARVLGTAGERRHAALRPYGIVPVAYGPGLAERVRALAPDGVDAAIDAAGTDEALDVSRALVGDPARIATLVNFRRGTQVGAQCLGAAPGHTDRGTDVRADAWRQLLPAATDGNLDVPTARAFPLDQAPAAHELLAAGHPGGKLTLHP